MGNTRQLNLLGSDDSVRFTFLFYRTRNPTMFLLLLVLPGGPALPGDDAAAVFEKRLKPIFDSPNPSSCTQCHLAGVDLKHYFQPTHRETFLSLRDQGLVDLDKPEKSKILALIEMGKGEKGAELIHE